jgi:transcriptional regulator with XRE-family HTH domain
MAVVNLYKTPSVNDLDQSGIAKKSSLPYGQGVDEKQKPTKLDHWAFSRNFRRLFDDLNAREGTTARQFAQDINVGEDQVSRWRSGFAAVPGLATMLKIATRFGVSVDVLLVGVSPTYSVQNRTARAKVNMSNSAVPSRNGGAHESTATGILKEIEARQRIIDLTNQQIADLASGLHTANATVPGVVAPKPVPRVVRRKRHR